MLSANVYQDEDQHILYTITETVLNLCHKIMPFL